jgi:phosphopantothenoylcysteine decarboxylase/phosphopantothenate--cysteine ligase
MVYWRLQTSLLFKKPKISLPNFCKEAYYSVSIFLMERYLIVSYHPGRSVVGTLGEELKGRRIVLCVTGCALAYQSAEIAIQMLGHGSEVYAVMSPMAQKIIHPNLLERATCNPVITEITGKIEHVALATGAGRVDLVCIAPASANTVSKISLGIADTSVTTVACAALGSKIPIVVQPAMHECMFHNPMVAENIERLKKLGVEFVGPRIEDGRFKLAKVNDVIQVVIDMLKS